MRKVLLAASILLLPACLKAEVRPGPTPKLRLAEDGETRYVIVQGKAPTEAEVFAARELAEHLQKVTGAEFPVVTEGEPLPKPHGIYVGWTEHADQQGVHLSELGEEEWVLRITGDDLVLAGGRPRGTLYAVYEFLESQVGCLWLDRDTEVIPSSPDLVVSLRDVRSKPAFWCRGYYAAWYYAYYGPRGKSRFLLDAPVKGLTRKPEKNVAQREGLFRRRNKGNAEDAPGGSARFGFGVRSGSPRGCHTFFDYVDPKIWFEKHPEYFSDDGTGRRTVTNMNSHQGSICVTNPEVRGIVVEQLGKFISKDLERVRQKGTPPPKIYDISQEDTTPHMCLCPECKAIIDREGSESGPNVAFINHVADAVRDEHPEVFVQTFAYVSTEQPPRTLTVRDNVVIRWCDLYSTCESIRPLTHPHNRKQAKMVRGWGAITKNIFVWDYWYYGSHVSPDTHVPTIQPDLKLFHENHVTGLFLEAEEHEPRQSFYALARWLGHKLMQDPSQPAEPLIEAFLAGYYGPAAPYIKEWLDYVEKRIAANPDKVIDTYPCAGGRRHWDLDFFVTAERLLQAAETACPPGSSDLLHVQIERVPVLVKLVELWRPLEAGAAAGGQPFPFDRAEALDRLEALWKVEIAACRSQEWGERLLAALPGHMEFLRHPPPLPAEFKDIPPDRVTQFFWNSLSGYRNELAEDSEAACGKARRLTLGGYEKMDHSRPLAFGVYDRVRKSSVLSVVMKPEETARDETYHLYKIGRARVGPGVRVWAHWSWLQGCPIDGAYQLADGMDPAVNDWDVYVSLKLTGPAYAPGSTQENAVWMDRVILVKP
ncbi:MAG: DUF4838 domain-containing protein [Lentisphaerae bacterium]|jgi:hypothetical protein|nr:DUF4838 domain-containing protein [Lentisphaerota bacterium]MBT7054946.1 DUF4838 domain-containing protein [Lentisphaerota bacterium]MBT7842793.1 DUF4838 domain-containing protein [Lentisphaerota bacterium]